MFTVVVAAVLGRQSVILSLHVDEDDDDAAVRAAILRKDDENQFLPACLSVSLGIIAFLCSPRLPFSLSLSVNSTSKAIPITS